MSQNAYQTWVENVAADAAAFEGRWTMLSLKRVDPDLADDLDAQRDLWHEAKFLYRSRADGHDELVAQGAALCRGYAVAVRTMEEVAAEDDAYVIGRCPRTGTTVAVTQQKAAGERVRELYGEPTIILSPDEVASLFGSIEALKAIGAIKQRFPGAEIIEKYPDEPAKEDA